jgi:hypothetical protein
MNARHRIDADTSDALDITITTAHVTDVEIAAVTAVVTAALREQADGKAEPTVPPSAWARSQRLLRTPIVPALGAWRGFSGTGR